MVGCCRNILAFQKFVANFVLGDIPVNGMTLFRHGSFGVSSGSLEGIGYCILKILKRLLISIIKEVLDPIRT